MNVHNRSDIKFNREFVEMTFRLTIVEHILTCISSIRNRQIY